MVVRTAMTALTAGVVIAAVGALLQAVQLPTRALGPAIAAAPTATDDAAGVLRVAGGSADVVGEADGDDGARTFTLRELHDGEVSVERFTAFWDAELDRVRAAACAPPTAAGSTVVVVDVGATPPRHVGEAYPDYAPLLAQARAAATADC